MTTKSDYQLHEDESIVRELSYPPSAHEKMELRLSMPREFWPKKWLDEEEASVQ